MNKKLKNILLKSFTFNKKIIKRYEIYHAIITDRFGPRYPFRILNFYKCNKFISLAVDYLYYKISLIRFFFLPLSQNLALAEVIKIRKKMIPKKFFGKYANQAEQIYNLGYSDITKLFNFNEIETDKSAQYFYKSKFYNSQVPFNSDKFLYDSYERKKFNYVSFDIETSLNNKFLSNFCHSKILNEIADTYLGFKSSLYSVNTMITNPNSKLHEVTSNHRDRDDFLFLTFFIYLSDTNESEGTRYFKNTTFKLDYKKENEIILFGKKGTVFAVDTFGVHSGPKDLKKERLVSWVRYGKVPNFSYLGDRNFYFI